MLSRTPASLLAALVFITFSFTACGADAETVESASQPLASDDTEGTSEAADLAFLREEEKLARDVYITLYEVWGVRIFDNISTSEQRHMDRILDLLVARGLEDPVVDGTVGAFTNPELSALYDDLVEQGSRSLADAFRVGATIEDLDIDDIRTMKTHTTSADVLMVYDRLECGSGNHMRAFARQLDGQGESYTAQFLTPDELAEVLDASHERCGRR